jgi:hypothetical protein
MAYRNTNFSQMPVNGRINALLRALSLFTVVLLIAIMAWLSQTDEDPCANPQSDISAAVLADQSGDQGALINRAIIMKSECDRD